MITTTNNKTRIAIALIVTVGAALLALILLTGKTPDAAAPEQAPAKAAAKPADDRAAPTAAHGDDIITLSAAQIKTAGIVIANAGPARIHTTTKLAGEIRFNDDLTAHVVPRLAGVVESVAANLGQQVRKGQVLAVIASPVLSEMRSELLSAQRREALAQLTFEREKKLWLDQISAEQDYLQAQQLLREAEIATRNARQKLTAIGAPAATTGSLTRFELRAPFDGAIVEKHIALGEAVKEDANVFKITDLSSVWAEIAVPAGDLQAVRVGARATVTATAMASTARGTVSYVGALIGEQTRTAQARVTLANPGLAWRPGMFVDVAMVSGERDAAVTVRSEALQTIDGKPTIFVKTATGFSARAVSTGASDGQLTEILSGLAAGTAYAAQGSFVVKAEQGKDSAEHAH
jgi:cobalt-zinc-cadmium efflux system membrane fusion protein